MICHLLFPLLLLTGFTASSQNAFDPFSSPDAGAAVDSSEPVKATLLGEQSAVIPGQKFSVAVKLDHAEHWHTFWRNPGQFAQSPSLTWTLPDGVKQENVLWGIPAVKDAGIPDVAAVQYIYEGTSYIVTEFSAPAALKLGDRLELSLKAKLQACKEQCIPLTFELKTSLPVAERAEPGAEASTIDALRKAQPQALAAWKVSIAAAGENWAVRAEPGEGAAADPGKLYFFDAAAATEATPQEWKNEGAAFTVTLTGQETKPPGQKPWGWITAEKSLLTTVEVKAMTAGEGSVAATAGTAKPAPAESAVLAISDDEEDKLIAEIRGWGVTKLGGGSREDAMTWPLALLFAFLGGIILNLMPCVFPVLGIKILGFVQQAGEDPRVVKRHGLTYALGVILSILLLMTVLLALRSAGKGWGFQLQNPWFLSGLIVLVFAFSLSMTGLFEVGARLTSVGAELQNESGYRGSFYSGLLTVLLATPCTGPFMGPALGFALDESTPTPLVVAVFLWLGIGLALPYVVLSWFPSLIKKLPRPGAWMETFKQFMAFPMFATVVWLLSVFGGTTGRTGATLLLFALTLVAMILWIYGRFFQRTTRGHSRTLAGLTVLLCLAGAVWLITEATSERAPASAGHGTPLSVKMIIERREKGLTTVVDLWAEWCLQCETNRKLAFDRKEFLDALPGYDAIFMLGDKTVEDSPADRTAQKFVEAYKSGGIPYAFIVPSKGPVIALPTVIASPNLLLDALEEAKKQSR